MEDRQHTTKECADKLILETILQDKFSYFKAEEGGVAGYAEAFRPVQSDSQTSEWYSYFENDVLVYCIIHFQQNDAE